MTKTILGYGLVFITVCNTATAVTQNPFSRAFTQTSADRCQTIDLRSQMNLPIRNQGDINWCYADSAADFLQFYYKLPNQISGADIAIRYNLGTWPRILARMMGDQVPQTGFTRAAMLQALADGYCPEEAFPSDFWVLEKNSLEKETTTQESLPLLKSIKLMFELQKGIQMGLYQKASDLPYRFKFKYISDDTFFELLKNTNTKKFLNQLRIAACDDHRKVFPNEMLQRDLPRIGMRLRTPNVFTEFHEALESGLPVIADYFYGVLEHADAYPHTFEELHSTLIFGRRFNAKEDECQYLIKDSFGTDCSDYDRRHDCEKGYLWVNESYLYGAMTSYVFMK